MTNIKIKLSISDLGLLINCFENSLIEMSEELKQKPKEINVYRFFLINKLNKRLTSKLENSETENIKLKLTFTEILVLRYCLVSYCSQNIQLTKIYIEIDKIIHPNLFERN